MRWYDSEKRTLPWRGTTDPYLAWVSEVMLQQTTVATVAPFFDRWISAFPTVEALADAREVDVLAVWQGLGYYRRARNLLAGARLVATAGWPSGYQEWLAIPGVGKYTAGAIASICNNERVAAVDGNVRRVYSRIHATDEDPSDWAWQLADCPRPGDINQALMDLGATVCRPTKPTCTDCPVADYCKAYKTGQIDEYPAKEPRRTVELFHQYAVPVHRGKFGVRRFEEGEWWAGMYGFPRGDGKGIELGRFRHTVTKHKVTATAFLEHRETKEKGLQWRSRRDLESLPMPSPHRKILALTDRINNLA